MSCFDFLKTHMWCIYIYTDKTYRINTSNILKFKHSKRLATTMIEWL